MRNSLCRFLWPLMLLVLLSAAHASPVVHLSAASFENQRQALLFEESWLYHAGDDPAWADTNVSDASWPQRRTWFRPADVERGDYSTTGWFRVHLTVDSSLAQRSLFVKIASVGAMEVFWDGARIYTLGKFSTDAATEHVLCGRNCQPLRLAAEPGTEHVLAVRFSNHQVNRLEATGTVAGFQAELILGNAPYSTAGISADVPLISWCLIAGLCLALLVMHLMIYAYYPTARENLTFAVFTGAIFLLAAHLILMMSTAVSSMDRMLFDSALLRSLVMLIALAGLHFVHEVGTEWKWVRSPRIWLIVLAGAALAFVLSTAAVYIIALLLMVEMTRTLVLAVKAKLEKIWILTIGFAAFIGAVAAEAAMVLHLIDYRPALDLLPVGGLAILALCMSAYLGIKFASINRSLAETVEHGRKAVRALVESEGRYRTMVENTVVGVGIVDDKGNLIFANDRYAEILDSTKEQLLNKDAYSPVVPEHLPGVQERIGRLVKGETRQVAHEFDIQCCEDGKRRTVSCSASLYTTRDGRRNLVVYSTDVTDQREAERKQREAIALAERTGRMASIGVMAGGITHEINQPLNAIMLHAETLQYMARSGKLDQTEAVDTALTHIVMGTERISEIIQHMRSFWISSPESDQLTTVDLNTPVRHALQLTEQKIRAHAISMRLELSLEPLPVKADALQLEQIVINLLTNAVAALDKVKRADKEICVRTYREGEDVGLDVMDNGPGLGELDAEKLFDPFYSTGKDKGGTGLGLAIVRMFVEKFKGTASGKNSNGGGAAFRVRLPLAMEVEKSNAHIVS